MDSYFLKNTKWIASSYMIFCSVITTLMAISALSLIGLSNLLPIKESLLLATLLALIFGSLKHKSIMTTNLSYKKSFFIGVGLFFLILPFFDLGALFMMQNQFHGTDVLHAQWSEYLTLYLIIFTYSIVFIGSWLSLVNGLMFLIFNQLILKQSTQEKISYQYPLKNIT